MQPTNIMCKFLQSLEGGLQSAGYKETYRGQAWGGANEWVYFDCVLNSETLREQHQLPDFIKYQEFEGTHAGNEAGFYCEKCLMGVMGLHPNHSGGVVSKT